MVGGVAVKVAGASEDVLEENETVELMYAPCEELSVRMTTMPAPVRRSMVAHRQRIGLCWVVSSVLTYLLVGSLVVLGEEQHQRISGKFYGQNASKAKCAV